MTRQIGISNSRGNSLTFSRIAEPFLSYLLFPSIHPSCNEQIATIHIEMAF